MKKELLERLSKSSHSAEECLNLLREELHHIILQELDRKGAFRDISFVGGTALRIVYGLDRYSEDLDFSLSNALTGNFDLTTLIQNVQKSLNAFGFSCDTSQVRTVKTVKSCFFNFRDILHWAHKSFPANQKLSIKLEVDTNPPKGAHELVSPISSFRLYKLRHHDLPSLFAGKLAAVLCRQYSKGRDLYDFLWHTARKTPVNSALLQNALEQMGKAVKPFDENALKKMLVEKFKTIDFKAAQQTTAAFLVHKDSLTLFDKDVFLNAVNNVIFAS